MRILITGYTTRMFGSTRIKGDYVTFSFLLEDILKEMGHTVERRQITIGEEINHVYDFAFCGVAPLNSMTSGKVPETHYVIDCLPGRHAVYADDWSFCGFGGSVEYTLNTWGKYLEYKNFPYNEQILKDTKKSLQDMMSHGNWWDNGPVLAPMFLWGDHNYLMRGNYEAKLWTIDPSAWLQFPSIIPFSPAERSRTWVMASLSDHSAWVKKQHFGMGVEYIGNKKYSNGRFFSEDRTVQYFAQNWGVLACKYPSAGSGWWRTRYHNAAWAEALLYADPLDQCILGTAYKGSPRNFESLTSEQYSLVVGEQNAWLQANTESKESVFTKMERLMKK